MKTPPKVLSTYISTLESLNKLASLIDKVEKTILTESNITNFKKILSSNVLYPRRIDVLRQIQSRVPTLLMTPNQKLNKREQGSIFRGISEEKVFALSKYIDTNGNGNFNPDEIFQMTEYNFNLTQQFKRDSKLYATLENVSNMLNSPLNASKFRAALVDLLALLKGYKVQDFTKNNRKKVFIKKARKPTYKNVVKAGPEVPEVPEEKIVVGKRPAYVAPYIPR